MGLQATAVHVMGHACCLRKLGAQGMWSRTQSSCWGRNCWVTWACCPDCLVDEPVCLSGISPAAEGDKRLDFIGSNLGLAQGPVEWQCVLVARVWHMVIAAASVGSWAGKKGWPLPWVQLGPTGQGPHVIPQQLSGLGISDTGARCWGHHYCSSQASWEHWSHVPIDGA